MSGVMLKLEIPHRLPGSLLAFRTSTTKIIKIIKAQCQHFGRASKQKREILESPNQNAAIANIKVLRLPPSPKHSLISIASIA
jgi:hypothetical protein